MKLKISAINDEGKEIFFHEFNESKIMNISVMDYAMAVLEKRKGKYLDYFSKSTNKSEAYETIKSHDSKN